MPESAEPFGSRVARARRRRGLSQAELARSLNRSVAWLSQVERGVRHIDRMSVLESLAEALDVPLAELASEAPVVAAQSTVDEAADRLKLVLLATGLAAGTPGRPAASNMAQLARTLEEAWQRVHAGDFTDLPPSLEHLITALDSACRHGDLEERPWHLLASAYQAMAAAFAKAGASDAAWIASDRAIQAAASSGDAVEVGASAFRLAVVFTGAKQYTYVEHAARMAAEALQPHVNEGREAARSVWGALTLQRAVAASRANDAECAYALLADARAAAEILGHGRNDRHTEFGPLNVAVHEVAIAVELGDAGRALRVAESIDTDALSAERRSQLLIDIARAQMQRRDGEQALRALLSAEQLAPDLLRRHHNARRIVSDLLALAEHPSMDLKGLARRSGLLAV